MAETTGWPEPTWMRRHQRTISAWLVGFWFVPVLLPVAVLLGFWGYQYPEWLAVVALIALLVAARRRRAARSAPHPRREAEASGGNC